MGIAPEDFFTVIRRPNPFEVATERIRGTIKARLLSPGDRLPPERELAAQLGVSRSTLRMALQSLIDEKWIEVRRGRIGGSFVARWPVMPHSGQLAAILARHRTELPALLDYRRAVEAEAAACTAARALPAEIAHLEALSITMQGRHVAGEIYRASDARFHVSIGLAARSRRLMAAVLDVQTALSEILDALIAHPEARCCRFPEQHWRIIDAIRMQDSEAARQAMLDHLKTIENAIYARLQETGAPAERVVGESVDYQPTN